MKHNIGKVLLAAFLFLTQMLHAYDATIPNVHNPVCAPDFCGTSVLPTCYTGGSRPTGCPDSLLFGCGYSGAGITTGDQCPGNPAVQQYHHLKHYRITQMIGINNDNGGWGSG